MKTIAFDPTRRAVTIIGAWVSAVDEFVSEGAAASKFEARLAKWGGADEDKIAKRRTRCRNMIASEFGMWGVDFALDHSDKENTVNFFLERLAAGAENYRTAERLIEAMDFCQVIDRTRGRRSRPGKMRAKSEALILHESFICRVNSSNDKPFSISEFFEIKAAWQRTMDAHLSSGGSDLLELRIKHWFDRTKSSKSWRQEQTPIQIADTLQRLRESYITMSIMQQLAIGSGSTPIRSLAFPSSLSPSVSTVKRSLKALERAGLVICSDRTVSAALTDQGTRLHQSYLAEAARRLANENVTEIAA